MMKKRNIRVSVTDVFHIVLGIISKITWFGFFIALVYFIYQVYDKEERVESLKDMIMFMFGYMLMSLFLQMF